jgi:peptidoglycan/LPS O-acetylase OafA/YrhL
LIHILVFHILSDIAMLPTSSIDKFLVIYGITVALSTATYLIIEKPTNQAGRKMVDGAQKLRIRS